MQLQTTSPLTLPKDGYSRASQLLPFLPFGQTTLWNWSKCGKMPKPIKLSPTVTAWRNADIHAWFDSLAEAANDEAAKNTSDKATDDAGSTVDNPHLRVLDDTGA